MSSSPLHDYFRGMLSGIEFDSFAHEIARYSLILADYPNPDGWRIALADAYAAPQLDEYLRSANIVLCNPPFGPFPNGERPQAALLFQRDAEALRRVLQHPPVMLGFVLPRPFLSRSECGALRRQIAETYRDISVTALPSGIFQRADVETILLIAHNGTSRPRYRSALVAAADRRQFLRTGEPTWEAETQVLPRSGSEPLLWQRPDWEVIWDALASTPRLETFLSLAGRGLQFNTGLGPGGVVDGPLPDFAPGINKVEEPFLIPDHQYLCREEKKLRRNPDLPWDKPKVIVNTFRSSRSFWRIKGAVDEDGLVFSEYCIGLWPLGETPVELLAAVISGPIANAYLWDRLTARANQIHVIRKIPVPLFAPEQTECIVSLVQDYQSHRGQWLAEPERAPLLSHKCLELLWQIDAEVLAAYDLPSELEGDLLARFTGARRPLPFDFPGYGDGYERAKQALDQEKEYQTTIVQYQALVDKKYAGGLTAPEAEDMERLGRSVDQADAPFYAAMLRDLQVGGK